MSQLETRILYYLGDTEFTDPNDLFAHFSMTPIEDMLKALNTIILNGEAKEVDFDGEKAYTRTMKGYTRLNPVQPGELDDIPF